jgi:hypothetical protein
MLSSEQPILHCSMATIDAKRKAADMWKILANQWWVWLSTLHLCLESLTPLTLLHPELGAGLDVRVGILGGGYI